MVIRRQATPASEEIEDTMTTEQRRMHANRNAVRALRRARVKLFLESERAGAGC